MTSEKSATMQLLLDWLRVLLPDFWIQNHPFSRTWEVQAQRLIAAGTPIAPIDRYNAQFGSRPWI